MSADPRSRAQRRRDTEHRLTHGIDVWVASASADAAPYLVPLSFDWDGEALLMATPTDSPTGRNLAATRAVRLGLGHTRDVSMIEGEVEVLEIDALPHERGDRFVAHTGFERNISEVKLSHTPRATSAVFDDPNLVSAAGLVPVLAVAVSAGLTEPVDERPH